MTQAFRVAGGASLDRARPVSFTFDGVAYGGYEGDTLASALLANGVRVVGRSYKYHRPRGILSAGAEEPNALVGLSRGPGRFTPNLRATQVELYDGLVAASQNRWPTLRYDIGEVNDVAAPLIGAGFYYKTFMGPNLIGKNWAWRHVYEPAIRLAAGLGAAPREADPDRYVRYFDHCDVLIVGAGPAGLAAALAAGASGAEVVLCDENAAPGGSLLAETRARIDGMSALDWLAEALAALGATANVKLMPRTQAFGYYAQNFLALSERLAEPELMADADLPRERLWQVRASEVVLATGAIERPLVFADNDRPGVMLAEAARRYLNQYGVKVGERIAIAAADDNAYRAALDLEQAGAKVEIVADLRDEPTGLLPQAARAAGIRVAVKAAMHEVRGRLGVEAVRLAAHPGGMRWVECDALLMSGGFTPSVHLFSQSRGKLAFDEALQAFRPGVSAQRERSAGACNAAFGLMEALAEGDAAGRAAASAAGFAGAGAALLCRRRCADRFGRRARRAAARPRRPPSQGFRRLPERRLRQGRRTRGAGGNALDRAHQALHHDRHGDRSGQALKHERARHRRRGAGKADRRGRPDHLPSAVYPRHFRRACRPGARRSLRSDPSHVGP